MPSLPRLCTLLATIGLTGSLAAPALASPLANAAQTATDEVPAWNVQVDPLTTALGIAHILLERRITANVAVYAGPSVKLYDNLLAEDDGYRAAGVEFGARWFFSGTAPKGWWAGGRATIANVSHNDASNLGGYISALGGYAWILDQRWVVSAALGVSYFDYHVGDAGVEGVLPGAHTAVGFAF